MRLRKVLASALFALTAGSAFAEDARLQVIHNAADPAAAVVDIYVNDALYEDDFAFRAATEFRTVPAGVTLNIGVAPGSSTSSADAIATIPVTLEAGKSYVAIANGVLDPSGFVANPDGRSIGFALYPYDRARESARWSWLVDLNVFHGATDAPGVDVRVSGWPWGALVDNVKYGDFSGYKSVPAVAYTLDLTLAGQRDAVVASYEVDLTGLKGGAVTVFASGFLSPADNQDGETFGLFAALPDGTVLPLSPAAATARLQVIHNAADPAAAVVDIYVNDDLYADDFAFRTATEFRSVPAGVTLNIGIAPASSASSADAIATIPVTLEAGKKYVAIANGVLDPSLFAANPDGRSIGFALYPYDRARETARWSWFFDLNVFHGVTDAPGVDVRVRGWSWGALVDHVNYGDFSGYKSVPAKAYTIDLTLAGQPDAVVASYEVDLEPLKGGAATVFASGFLSPADNQDGEAFGLYAALPDGAVVPLNPVVATARLQVIHNAADPAAAVVDIYVNDEMYEDDFAFRAATEFRTVPANVTLNIGVAPGSSTSSADAIATIPVVLEAGKTYVAIANGVLEPSAFAANPDGRSIGFALYPRDGILEEVHLSRKVKVIGFHGASDAPTVDIRVRRGWGSGMLFGELAYGDFSQYRNLKPEEYELDITLAGQPKAVVATFEADLSGLGGGTAVVFASGFLSPADNQDGEAFGLFAALADGTVVGLPAKAMASSGAIDVAAASTGELPRVFELRQNFPNPFNPATSIAFTLPEASEVTLKVYNVLGQEVRTLVNGRMEAGEHQIDFDARGLASGLYFYRIDTDSEVQTRKMTLMK